MASTGEARTFERQAEAPQPWALGLAARLRPALIPAASIAGLILLWQLAALIADDPRRLPAPGAVLHAITLYTASGELPYHLGITLLRVAASFVIAMAIGIAIGIAMGRVPLFDRIAHPWLVFFLNMPALVTIVLAYIWIGLVESALIFAVAINKIPNAVVTVREGARALDKSLLEMAAVFRIGVAPHAAPRRPAAALSLSRRGRPLGPRPDLEDRAGGRAARPLERRRLPDRAAFPAVRRHRHPRLRGRLRRGDPADRMDHPAAARAPCQPLAALSASGSAIRHKRFAAVGDAPAKLVIENLTARGARRTAHGAVRPVGLRQDHAAQPGRRAGPDFAGEVALPEPARIGYVFQEPRLLPWLTVEDNLKLVLADDPYGDSQVALWLADSAGCRLSQNRRRFRIQARGNAHACSQALKKITPRSKRKVLLRVRSFF